MQNEKLKIAIIGHKQFPSRTGGIEVVVEELATRLAAMGDNVVCYDRYELDKTRHYPTGEYKGVKIKLCPTLSNSKINAMLASLTGTIKLLFHHPNVAHYHAIGPCAMIFLPHLFGIHTVATIHGLDWQRSKWGGFATKYIKFGEKLAVKYADEIIVLSKGVQKYFKDTYNRDTHFIQNGVNKPVISKAEEIKKKWNLEKDNYILFLARIVPEKGLHYLIEAYKQIKTNKKLVIAGGASHTNDYLQSIKEMIKSDDRIVMTGFVQGKILDELFSNCYLYCLPSDIEGMPISLLEAMSYGNNCLVSDVEENTQVTDKYAMQFKKSDVNDLQSKLRECLDGKNRIESNVISDYVLKKYNWDDVVERTLELYRR